MRLRRSRLAQHGANKWCLLSQGSTRRVSLVIAVLLPVLLVARPALAWQAYDCGGYYWPTPSCPTGSHGIDPNQPVSPDTAHISRIDINALSGLAQIPHCSIGSSNTSCEEDSFTIASYGPDCTPQSCPRGCNATIVYNDG